MQSDILKEQFQSSLKNLNIILDWAVLMITDVLREHSVLFITDFRAKTHLPYSSISDRVFDMPGIMSRKKQLLPEILHAISE